MYFQSFKEFIEMGGHAEYVWQSYSTVLFALIVYYFYSKKLVKNRQKELISFYRRMDARTQQSSTKKHPRNNE